MSIVDTKLARETCTRFLDPLTVNLNRLKVSKRLLLTIYHMESRFVVNASSGSAHGLGQLQPHTAVADVFTRIGCSVTNASRNGLTVDSLRLPKETFFDGTFNTLICALALSFAPKRDRMFEIYVAWNLGSGSLSKLKRGVSDAALERLISGQASYLRTVRPGMTLAGSYLLNAEEEFNSVYSQLSAF